MGAAFNGWRYWLDRPPCRSAVVEIARIPNGITAREPVPLSTRVRVCDIPPWFNIAGLLWRYDGECWRSE